MTKTNEHRDDTKTNKYKKERNMMNEYFQDFILFFLFSLIKIR